MTRDFVRTAITPFAADWGRNETVPLPTVFKIGALGLSGVRIPAEWAAAGPISTRTFWQRKNSPTPMPACAT